MSNDVTYQGEKPAESISTAESTTDRVPFTVEMMELNNSPIVPQAKAY